jgi:hypothetical protein
MIGSNRRWLPAIVAAALFPANLAGQTVTRSLDELQRIPVVGHARTTAVRAEAAAGNQADEWRRVDTLEPGTRSVVTLKTGEKRVGDFRRVTADGVTIAVRPKNGDGHAREETLPKSLIAAVATASDPVWNGALIGAGVGTGLAVWDYLIDPSEPGNAAVFTVAIGLGTAIGAGVDALLNQGGRVLYASPRQTREVSVSPLLGKDRRGVLVSLRF